MAQIPSIHTVGNYTCLHLPIGTRLRPICNIEIFPESLGKIISWAPPINRIGSCNLSKLLRDMSEYHLSTNYQNSHSGDLMDHSLWTYYLLVNETTLPKIFQPWFLQKIPESYYPVLQVAGLLHDIGKAGDLDLEYTQKPNHPLQSWLYFRGLTNYIWVNGNQILLTQYLAENCALTSEEWSLVAIIAGLHYDLGNFLEGKLSMKKFIQRLTSYIRSTGVTFDPVMVFRILRAVTFADVWAQRPVKALSGSVGRKIQHDFVQIDSDIVPKQRRSMSVDNWKKYFNEEKFALSRQLEEQIEGFLSESCVGPIGTYVYNPNEGNVILTRPINLIILIPENIQYLLVDPESPYNYSGELDPDIYKLITGRNPIELRKYLIYELMTEIEICSFPFAKEARNEIYHWYFSTGENKLSNESIRNLLRRLEDCPRFGWTPDRIEMTIRRLVSPDYSLEEFIREYDQTYYNDRIKYLEKEIQNLMKLISPLQYKYFSQPFESWDGLIEMMSKEDSFQTPLLSPKGLLTFRNILQGLGCRIYQNTALDNLLNYIFTSPTGLFGEKYNIYGLYIGAKDQHEVMTQFYINKIDVINLLSPYNYVYTYNRISEIKNK